MQEIATHSAGELRYFDLGELFYVVPLPGFILSFTSFASCLINYYSSSM